MSQKRCDVSLRGKINIRFIVLAIVAIVLASILQAFVYYELFKAEVFKDLKAYTHVLSDSGIFDNSMDMSSFSLKNEDLRITLVSHEGKVLYDSIASASDMTNHVDRPEILEAFNEGEGQAVRLSETLNKSTFYYAVLLDSGCVLRVSKESDSVLTVFLSGLPYMALILLVLLIFAIIISHFLTKSIVRPIEHMANDMDHIDMLNSYKEIRPFINTIKKQHENIVQNAKMRQDFTANVSHELKTPLTSISGYSELIENGMATDDDVRRFASEIHRNSDRLLTLINDIIRLSELDVVEDKPSMEKVDLYMVARTAVDMLMMSANMHEVTLELDETSSPSYIMANKMMMDEIVYNLTDNAIRYNNKGGSVKLKVATSCDKVVLTVKDTGIGIPKEHLEFVFQRFYRVDKSRSKQTGGTGLGLAIVKHIAAKHNADIKIMSEPGKGTEINIVFEAYKS